MRPLAPDIMRMQSETRFEGYMFRELGLGLQSCVPAHCLLSHRLNEVADFVRRISVMADPQWTFMTCA